MMNDFVLTGLIPCIKQADSQKSRKIYTVSNNMNKPVSIKEIESTVKNLPKQKAPDGFSN